MATLQLKYQIVGGMAPQSILHGTPVKRKKTMISAEVTVGLLSLVGTLIGTAGGILASNKLTNYRIAQLEERVKVHNNLIERVYRLEDNDKLMDERIDNCKDRITVLERGTK